MPTVTLAREDDFEGWRRNARALALAGVPPAEVSWQVGDAAAGLFARPPAEPQQEAPAFSVPRAFLTLAECVIGHSDPERFGLLYAMLVRLRQRPQAFEEGGDPLLQRLERMAREARAMEIRKKLGAAALVDGTGRQAGLVGVDADDGHGARLRCALG